MTNTITIRDLEEKGEVIWEHWWASVQEQREEYQEEKIKNVLSDTTLFDFDAYCNAVKYLSWRNIGQNHKTSAEKRIIVKRRFDQAIEKLAGKEQDEKAYEHAINGLDTLKRHDIKDKLTLFHSPSAMVSADLEYRIETRDRDKAMQTMLGNLYSLHTKFTFDYDCGVPTITLLDGLFKITYDSYEKNVIVVRGEKENHWKIPPNGYARYTSFYQWRGKASNFANFVYTMQRACIATECHGQMIHGEINVVFYTTIPSHEEQKVYPREIIGMIKAEIPWIWNQREKREKGEKKDGKIKVYSGKDMNLFVDKIRSRFY